jgi:hypothetical protein
VRHVGTAPLIVGLGGSTGTVSITSLLLER